MTSAVNYGTNTTITMDLINSATSSTFLAGRECSQVDNTANLFNKAHVSGTVKVGTTPTINTFINVYVWGAQTSLATTAIDVLDGTDSAETLTHSGVLYSLRVGCSIWVPATTSDLVYPVLPFEVSALFGAMPKFWGLFVSHNTGVNLHNSSANTNAFSYYGIKYD